jgi:hypothetical protein
MLFAKGNIGIICFWNPIEVTDPEPTKNTTNIWFVNQVSDADSWEPLIIWPCHILSRDLEIPGKT